MDFSFNICKWPGSAQLRHAFNFGPQLPKCLDGRGKNFANTSIRVFYLHGIGGNIDRGSKVVAHPLSVTAEASNTYLKFFITIPHPNIYDPKYKAAFTCVYVTYCP